MTEKTQNAFDGDSELDQDTKPQRSDRDGSLICAVESNGQLLEQLLDQFANVRELIVAGQATHPFESLQPGQTGSSLSEDSARLQKQIAIFEERVAELEQQNGDLASRVADNSVRDTVASVHSGSSDALSWEDRKKLILQQMEDDTFEAEAFHESLQAEASDETVDPIAYVKQLHTELARKDDELERRETEIHELQCLLEDQAGTREGGVAIGAAAIAEMVDSDDLIRQERDRLQQLQDEWQEKFRKEEIEASLERAKLSRERLELARKNSDLEEQLEHIRREARQTEESGTSSRRWLAKLGLAGADE